MDSFELNKIIAAVLLTALIIIGIGKLTDILFHVDKPKESAYKIEGLEEGFRKWNPETNKVEETPTGLETVGELIERLKQYDPNTKVAVNVAVKVSFAPFDVVQSAVPEHVLPEELQPVNV